MDKKIKVINFVPEELPSYRPDIDVLYSKELPKQDVDTTIVGMPDKETLHLEGESTRLLTSKKTSNRHLDSLVYFFNAIKLAFQAKKSGFDLIQVRDMVWVGLVCMLIAKLIKLPTTYWVSFLYAESRTMRAKDKSENIPRWKRPIILVRGILEEFILYRMLLPHSDRVYVQSDFMIRYMKNKGIDADNMVAVPMGVDFDKVESFTSVKAKRIEHWGDAPIIAYLGSLDRLRKLEVIIEGFKQAKNEEPNLKLLFVGDSEIEMDREFLQKTADEFGITEDFHITGWQKTEDAWAYLKDVDVVVSFVSRGLLFDVSTPTKALEYMALKKAMICNDSPDQQFVIEQSGCGRLTDGSPQSFAAAMVDLVRSPIKASVLDDGYHYIKRNRSYTVIGQQVAADIKHVIQQQNS